ncbi:M1 family metallopeptidase [Flaviaesturariibacter terrae]
MLRKLLSLLLLLPLLGRAQDIDVQHYRFQIGLHDETDRVDGIAIVVLRVVKPVDAFELDLVQPNASGKGMIVSKLTGANVAGWLQADDKIRVRLKQQLPADSAQEITIVYSGVPRDGLIISKNKWGDRTFFADNWPNRAHHWIPCNDRPDDKASFEFRVTAPAPYTVIANGTALNDETAEDPDKYVAGGRHFYYREDTPLPTKVMVIGAARFAVKTFEDSPQGIPVSAWVYPQDSTKGFYDYAVTPSILKFFSNYIAPFPYEKLANVQSKTIFGGMENASCIFYAEESVTGNRKWEDVFAHEIAHQWFGDMASEKSFAHLWLSEGFATYMTDLYIEQKYGVDSMRKRLETDRMKIIIFTGLNPTRAVVDSTKDLMSLLNANSYDKGGWVLHMLRQQVGDSAFRKIIQSYYQSYKGGNADTRDFQRVADSVYNAMYPLRKGESLATFFDQWLYRPGIPAFELKLSAGSRSNISFVLRQEGTLYSFPLEIEVSDASGKKDVRSFWIRDRETTLPFGRIDGDSWAVVVDPNKKLLYRLIGSVGKSGNYFRVKRQLRTYN